MLDLCPMLNRTNISVCTFFLAISFQTYAVQTESAQSSHELRETAIKKIEKTLYCSHMESKIDRARPADRTNITLKADRIVVSKSRRKLYLLRDGALINEYPVAFGFGVADGPKIKSGDGRTPEGLYEIDAKKEKSSYTKALHISYPNDADNDFAKDHKLDAGGSIMIHGLPPKPIDHLDPETVARIHPRVDWTQGCIAVQNAQIEEIFNYVDEGTAIEICALDADASYLVEPTSKVTEVVTPNEVSQDLDPAPM